MADHGAFSGEPKTIWLTEAGSDRNMRLIERFSYTNKGKETAVPAGFDIDGASIPRPLWSLVGSPYTGDYRRASIVHDKACVDAAGDKGERRRADKMFFHACMAGGCSWAQAAVLYLGVRIGATRGMVEAWSVADIEADTQPRLSRSQADIRIEDDFKAAAKIILNQGETEDSDEVERRTDASLEMLTGVAFRDL